MIFLLHDDVFQKSIASITESSSEVPQDWSIKPCMGTIFYEDGLDNMKSDGIIV
jgi:hypothetical protein